MCVVFRIIYNWFPDTYESQALTELPRCQTYYTVEAMRRYTFNFSYSRTRRYFCFHRAHHRKLTTEKRLEVLKSTVEKLNIVCTCEIYDICCSLPESWWILWRRKKVSSGKKIELKIFIVNYWLFVMILLNWSSNKNMWGIFVSI